MVAEYVGAGQFDVGGVCCKAYGAFVVIAIVVAESRCGLGCQRGPSFDAIQAAFQQKLVVPAIQDVVGNKDPSFFGQGLRMDKALESKVSKLIGSLLEVNGRTEFAATIFWEGSDDF